MKSKNSKKRSIGERIRSARRFAKLTQAELAKRAGVSASAAAQWEHPNGTQPSIESLSAIAIATSTSFEWLATGRSSIVTDDQNETPALKLGDFAQSTEEEELLKLWRQARPRTRSRLLALLMEIA